jgi:hypothetical protein
MADVHMTRVDESKQRINGRHPEVDTPGTVPVIPAFA